MRDRAKKEKGQTETQLTRYLWSGIEVCKDGELGGRNRGMQWYVSEKKEI